MNRSRPALVVFWTSIGVIVATLLVLGTFQWRANEEVVVESVGSRPAATRLPEPDAHAQSLETVGLPEPDADRDPRPRAWWRLRCGCRSRLSTSTRRSSRWGWTRTRPSRSPRTSATWAGTTSVCRPASTAARPSSSPIVTAGCRAEASSTPSAPSMSATRSIVKTSAGDELPYEVVARESILKKRLPYEELFAVDGPPRLTLISCGGYYDPNNGGYQDNVVVTAVPMFEPIPTDPIQPEPSASSPPRPARRQGRREPPRRHRRRRALSPSPPPRPPRSWRRPSRSCWMARPCASRPEWANRTDSPVTGG